MLSKFQKWTTLVVHGNEIHQCDCFDIAHNLIGSDHNYVQLIWNAGAFNEVFSLCLSPQGPYKGYENPKVSPQFSPLRDVVTIYWYHK
jgi:hypothetical protein